MDTIGYLKDYSRRADKYLDIFFQKKIIQVKEIDRSDKKIELAKESLERYRKFLVGGKKLRGALIQLGFEIAGGRKKDVLEASTSIEIIHSFLLMHDDVIDMDSVRRGEPTIHEQYFLFHKRLRSIGDPHHYGVSMAINTGDLGAFLGMEVLLQSRLEIQRKIKAALYLSRLIQGVTYGQGLDVTYERINDVTEKDVLKVHLYKTSIYTLIGPLKIGGILGGLSTSRIRAIEKFGKPIGIAFQLRDDELGLFSDEKTIGKPVGGDIKEGKNTLLHIKALELAKGKDNIFLKNAYGNKKITKDEVAMVRDITIKSGALDYSRRLSKKLVGEGKKFIPAITKDTGLQDTLGNIAEFVIAREN